MLTELKQIFESVDKEILNEDTLKAISSIMEEKVNQKVQERVGLEVENAVKTQYEKFKVVSEKALKAIDNDHLAKVKTVVDTLKEEHNKQLVTVSNGYKKIIAETAVKHRDTLVESVDEFLDMYIEKNLPKEEIAEAAKNKYALKAIEEARKVLGVDEKFISGNIKKAMIDGKQKMDRLLQENAELKKKTVVSESKKVLAEKTASLPVEVARFVRSRLAGKDAKFIEENFGYVVDMYKRNEATQKRSALLNENKNFNVDRKRVADEILKENENRTTQTVNPNNPMEDLYMSGLNFRK